MIKINHYHEEIDEEEQRRQEIPIDDFTLFIMMIHLRQQVLLRLSILPLLIVIMMEMMIVMVNQELDLKNLVQGIPTRFIS